MDFRIAYVPDEVMDGRDYILCHKPGESATFYMRRGIRALSDVENAEVWMDAWAAFRRLADVGEIPPQRDCERLSAYLA